MLAVVVVLIILIFIVYVFMGTDIISSKSRVDCVTGGTKSILEGCPDDKVHVIIGAGPVGLYLAYSLLKDTNDGVLLVDNHDEFTRDQVIFIQPKLYTSLDRDVQDIINSSGCHLARLPPNLSKEPPYASLSIDRFCKGTKEDNYSIPLNILQAKLWKLISPYGNINDLNPNRKRLMLIIPGMGGLTKDNINDYIYEDINKNVDKVLSITFACGWKSAHDSSLTQLYTRDTSKNPAEKTIVPEDVWCDNYDKKCKPIGIIQNGIMNMKNLIKPPPSDYIDRVAAKAHLAIKDALPQHERRFFLRKTNKSPQKLPGVVYPVAVAVKDKIPNYEDKSFLLPRISNLGYETNGSFYIAVVASTNILNDVGTDIRL